MSRHQIRLTVLDLVFSGSLILAACASPAPAPTLDNATPAIAPTVSIATTATPVPLAAKDPATFTQFIPGDPGTLDPSIGYGVGVFVNGQIYETLLSYDGARINRFRPLLAEAMPDPAMLPNGGL